VLGTAEVSVKRRGRKVRGCILQDEGMREERRCGEEMGSMGKRYSQFFRYCVPADYAKLSISASAWGDERQSHRT
jgi:hypothetical protein